MTRARAKQMSEAAAAAASVGAAKEAVGERDPFTGELRRAGLLPALVLHLVARGPSYGNQLMERIAELTGGLLSVNPNTMYPLLRTLEGRGLIAGEWEHPERRSRRFYAITDSGREECARLKQEIAPRLDRVAEAVTAVRRELAA